MYTNDEDFLDESLDRLTRNDPTLTILNLNHVGIGNASRGLLHPLATALSHNTHLIVLFLNNNDLYGRSSYFVDFCKSLGRHPTLKFLYMSYNSELGDAGATVLAQHAIRSSHGGTSAGGLKVLKLAHCNIGPVGAKALAEALKLQQQRHVVAVDDACCSCGGLQSLVLEHNRLGARGIMELAGAMRYNTSLKSLNVRHNHIVTSSSCTAGAASKKNAAAGDLPPVQQVQAAFVDSLCSDNRTLSELLLLKDDANRSYHSSRSQVGRELHYYMAWNRLGRRHVGDAAIRATVWTRVLSKATTALTTDKQQQHLVKKKAPPLPPLQQQPPSLLFTTLRARPDLLQQPQQQQDQSS
jgi:Leucine Rich repeat